MTHIREAKKEEFNELYELYLSLLQSYPEAYADSYEVESKKDPNEWKDTVSDSMHKVFVVEMGEKLVGMAEIEYPEHSFNIPFLGKMGIVPEFQRQGLGLKLMEACTEYLKNNNAKEMRLYVVSDREDTINFYTRYGFKVIETLNGDILHAYYEEWKDVYVMQKLL